MENYKNNLSGKRVLIMGLGRNNGGKGCVIFAIKSGAKEILVTDMKDREFNKPSIDEINDFITRNNLNIDIKYVFLEHKKDDFLWAQVVIKNPAVPFTNEFIKIAKENGAEIETEITLFLKNKNPESKIIGITGSKGKSSTTYLIYHILSEAKKENIISFELNFGGNMGISLLQNLNINFNGIYILELSSFVTEAIEKANLKIDYYLITSLYPDHLNHYKSLDEYYHSKVDLIQNIDKKHVFVNSNNNDLQKMTKNYDINKINTLKTDNIKFPEYFNEGLKQNTVLVSEFLNKEFNISFDFISKCLKTYEIVEGRFEFLGNIKNVDFINDTCASIPEAAIMGLNTLSNKNKNIFIITGGSDKGLKFDEFFKFLNNKVNKIYLLKGGNTFDLFCEKLDKNKLIICENLEDAVNIAFMDAKDISNSVVILSRGCTSFGIANNEFEMGREFKNIFEKMKN